MKVRSFFVAVICVGAGLLGLTPAAFAQSGADVAARRELLQQAQTARTGRDHMRALDFARRAGAITMTASVRRFIAEEEAAVGQIAEALGSSELCMREAEREAPSANRTAVMTGCRTLHNSLTARVARLVVRVPPNAPPGLHVTIAGQPLRDAFWGVPYVVSPGRLTIEASAPGQLVFRQDVTVASGAVANVDIAMRPDPAAVGVAPSRQPVGAGPVVGGTVHVIIRAPDGSRPAQTQVLFDGMLAGGDPPSVQGIPPGDHVLEVNAPGFQRVRREVPIAAGQLRVVAVDLVPAVSVGTIRVSIPIPNAVIYLDGVPIGAQHAQRDDVPAGLHRLQISAPGYQTMMQDVTVTQGQTLALNVPGLPPASGVPGLPPGMQGPPMPAPPPPGSIPVSFESDSSRIISVSISSTQQPPQSCVTPCSLPIIPGPVHLSFVSGSLRFQRDMQIPRTAAARVRLHAASARGRYAGGVLLSLVGALGFTIGYFVGNTGGSAAYSAGLAFEIVGGALAVLGVGLVVLGGFTHSSGEVVTPSARATRQVPRGLRFVTAGIAPVQGGGAVVGAAFSF